jgi:two-component system cell cycle sensor histidine kinase/response regulator CckA
MEKYTVSSSALSLVSKSVQTGRPVILNVDDDEDRLQFRTLLLREHGFGVLEARTGNEALRLALDRRPALVLLDVNLPDVSGIEVCRRLKAHPVTAPIPVLHISAAMTDEEHWTEGLRVGGDNYLRDPISGEVLIEVVRTLLRRVDSEHTAWHARDEAEDALRRSEQRYRALFEHAPYGILQVAFDGRLLAVNHALVSMLGYRSRAELMAVGHVGELYANPADRAKVLAALQQHSTIRGLELPWRKMSGQPLIVRLSSRIIADGYETFVEDITERQALEEELRQSQKLEALGRLAGGVAHDFNNMLTVIGGYADMLAAQIGLDKPIGQDLDQIRAAARHAASLTYQLLAFSRRQPLNVTVVDLPAVVARTLNLLKRLVGETIMLSHTVTAECGTIRADAAQLQQVLFNLAVNARHAMPDGGYLTIAIDSVEISNGSTVYSPPPPGRYVRLLVGDTGVGMDEITKRRIFEPFFTTRAEHQGTGLGLSTVYGIVRQLGGYIRVESAPGEGARFELYFPETRESIVDAPIPHPIEVARQQLRILVVEDESAVRKFVVTALQRFGYEVTAVEGPVEALNLPDDVMQSMDVLVTDMVLPLMSGAALAERLRTERPDLRVLLISGYGTEGIEERHEWAAPGMIVPKPFTAAELLEAIQRIL